MMNVLLASVSGLLMFLIFPKFNLYLIAYIALVPFLISIRRARSVFEAVLYGQICGMIFFGGFLFWVNTLTKWAGWWAILAWITLTISQAVFIAVFAGISKYLSGKKPDLNIIIMPAIWTVIEWLRSLGPYGITGGGLGYSQAGFLPVLQIACFMGIYGISFLIVIFNEAIVEAYIEKKNWGIGVAVILLTIALLFGFYRIRSFRDHGKPLKIAIVQANIPQDVKLNFDCAYELVDIHELMSRKALPSNPDIVVWPETAVTTYLFESDKILSKIRGLFAGGNACYLIGTPYRKKDRIYNSVVAFSKNGRVIGRYDKQRLVPFGEYLPMRPFSFYLLQENPMFTEDYNSNEEARIIDLGIAKAGVVICFESTFPYLVRDKVKKGAQFILVATNDAWFFDSAAPYQHLQAARVRAVENGMYVVQAANTGISAIIDPLGRIVKRSKIGKDTVLQGRIYVH